MRRALLNPERCRNCEPCEVIARCPMQAVFREQAGEQPWVDFYRCSGCLKCKGFCPHHAVDEITHPCDGGRRMGW